MVAIVIIVVSNASNAISYFCMALVIKKYFNFS